MNIEKIRDRLEEEFPSTRVTVSQLTERTFYVDASTYEDKVYTHVSSFCQSADDFTIFEERCRAVFG